VDKKNFLNLRLTTTNSVLTDFSFLKICLLHWWKTNLWILVVVSRYKFYITCYFYIPTIWGKILYYRHIFNLFFI